MNLFQVPEIELIFLKKENTEPFEFDFYTLYYALTHCFVKIKIRKGFTVIEEIFSSVFFSSLG